MEAEDNRTPFSIEASARNANIVQKLIEQGHDVNAKDEQGNTALFYASTQEIAKILLDKGTSPDEEGFAKNTHEKLLKDVMQRLKNGEDKDGIINTLIEISINEDTRAELIKKVLNYNVNDNNPVAAPALVTPVATPIVVPAPSTSTEEKLLAEVKTRLTIEKIRMILLISCFFIRLLTRM
ncbi:hypothetical protein GCO76_02375 [Rickettsia sp. R2]